MAISNSGYIAPEHGQLGTESTKADVYAFGVLLLELLTGKKPFDRCCNCVNIFHPSWVSLGLLTLIIVSSYFVSVQDHMKSNLWLNGRHAVFMMLALWKTWLTQA